MIHTCDADGCKNGQVLYLDKQTECPKCNGTGLFDYTRERIQEKLKWYIDIREAAQKQIDVYERLLTN